MRADVAKVGARQPSQAGHARGRHSVCHDPLFLLGNGVLPRAIAAYLSGAGLLADRRARAHIWDIMRDFRDGKLRLDARYWGLREGAVVCVSDSMWAHGVPRDIRGCEIWEPARDLLME